MECQGWTMTIFESQGGESGEESRVPRLLGYNEEVVVIGVDASELDGETLQP